jgi:hypothetical protein
MAATSAAIKAMVTILLLFRRRWSGFSAEFTMSGLEGYVPSVATFGIGRFRQSSWGIVASILAWTSPATLVLPECPFR